MNGTQPLCVLPPSAPLGCCSVPPPPPAAPLLPQNPPGLPAIAYRIGTFTTFRRAMLDIVALPDLLGSTANPFAQWTESTDGDYHTLLIELWAYLADILTFYQERIANEAYLPAATERDSLLRLAALIDYRPSPGAGASGLVAFTVEKGKAAAIPAGFRTGSKAQPGKPAAVFETEAPFTGRGEHSAIPLSPVAPTNQFAQLSSVGRFFGSVNIDPLLLASAAAELYGSAGATYLSTLRFNTSVTKAITGFAFAESVRTATLTRGFRNVGVLLPRFISTTTRVIVLQGTNNRLSPGDYVLTVENEGASGENARLWQLTDVSTDKTANTTSITWKEPAGTTYDRTSSDVAVYTLRVTAGAFGDTAPIWQTLPSTLNGVGKTAPDGAPYKDENWDDPANSWHWLPTPGDAATQVYLDAVSDAVRPGWAVLLTDTDRQVLHLTDARPVSRSAYSITAKVTRLTFQESVKATAFPFRSTAILAGSERLLLQNDLPLPDPVAGDKLILSGLLPQLQAGQAVVLKGNLYDPDNPAAAPVGNAEARTLKNAPVVDAANQITTVTLDQPLDRQYTRAGCVLLANVAQVTQGETVRNEVLGSGNGGAFQAFPLKQKPLTYLPSADPEGLSAVQSTLAVTVNGVKWQEVPTLLESDAAAPVYTATQDNTGQTTVTFGDGFHGAAPPTGSGNISARYRKGLGASGNAGPDGIQQLIDSLPGVQKVTNPVAASGGADAESIDQIRRSAPASVRAFGRAVSAPDYAALALSFPGIAKASAAWVTRGPDLKALAHPYVQLVLATPDRTPLSQQPVLAGQLRNFLDQRRDPNVPLRIVDFGPVYIDLAATVDIDDRYPRQATLLAAQSALDPSSEGFFAFDRLDFGQSIPLSAVYAALQQVPGVSDVLVTTLRRLDLDSGEPDLVRDNIFVRPTEIVVIANDPTDPAKGTLAVNPGRGGFADQ